MKPRILTYVPDREALSRWGRFAAHLRKQGILFREQQGFYAPFYRIADFYLPEQNLIGEIDGPYHDPKVDWQKDERYRRTRGVRTTRLTNEQVLSGRIPDLF